MPPLSTARLDTWGLTAMAEQADEIGWRLSIQSQPGQGTSLRIEETGGEV